MWSLGHCRQILANEKQESIATISMKKKHLILFVAHCSHALMKPTSSIELKAEFFT